MFSLLVIFALFVVGTSGQADAPSPPLDINLVKCFFIVFGEFNHDQAISACSSRNGSLATFNTPSEDHVIRHKIDWNTVPGYQDGKFWIGQLWIGGKRVGSGWQWNTPMMPGIPFSFASWIGDPSAQALQGQDCTVAQENGWIPYRCDALNAGKKMPAGALCESVTRTGPNSDVQAASTNYCEIPLMPASYNNVGLPLVQEKTFILIKGNFSFETASQACAGIKGQLANLKSSAENEFVFKNIDLGSVNGRAWIGLRRTVRGSSSFIWTDGFANINQLGFLSGRPNNSFGGTQDCVAFIRGDSGTIGWADVQCSPFGTVDGKQPISALCETFVTL